MKLSAAKAEKAPSRPVAPVEKELVFEKENQAVLSSDQRSVCLDWWRQLKPEVQEAIRNREMKIRITGYTSPTGTTIYNTQLADKRAQHISDMLTYKIGKDTKGESLAIIQVIGEGEDTDDDRRYVKIEIMQL